MKLNGDVEEKEQHRKKHKALPRCRQTEPLKEPLQCLCDPPLLRPPVFFLRFLSQERSSSPGITAINFASALSLGDGESPCKHGRARRCLRESLAESIPELEALSPAPRSPQHRPTCRLATGLRALAFPRSPCLAARRLRQCPWCWLAPACRRWPGCGSSSGSYEHSRVPSLAVETSAVVMQAFRLRFADGVCQLWRRYCHTAAGKKQRRDCARPGCPAPTSHASRSGVGLVLRSAQRELDSITHACLPA